MLSLVKAQPFAKGSDRLVYVHPHDPDLCVKVPSRPRDSRCRKAQRRELRDWAWLQRWGRKAWFSRIPAIKGVVSTDLGDGVVSTLYRDESGRIARSLLQILREEGLTPSLTQAIDELEEWLRQHQLPTWDTGPHNVVAVRRGDDRWTLFIIEGWVHRRCHRFPWWVNFAGEAMADRQIRKFRRRLVALSRPADRSPDE